MSKHKAQHHVKQMSPKYLPGNPKARTDDLRLVMDCMPNSKLSAILLLLLVAQGVSAIEAANCRVAQATIDSLSKRCSVSASTLPTSQSKTANESCAYLIKCTDTNENPQFTRVVAPAKVGPALAFFNKGGNIGIRSINQDTSVSRTLEYTDPCTTAPRK